MSHTYKQFFVYNYFSKISYVFENILFVTMILIIILNFTLFFYDRNASKEKNLEMNIS